MKGRIVRAEETVSLPVIGKVKIGERVTNSNGKEYPKSLDYFKSWGKYKSYFDSVYPDKPNKISIIFISDDINLSCHEIKILRNTKGDIYGKGDNVEYSIWNESKKDYETFFIKDHPDIEKKCEDKVADTVNKKFPKWQSVLTLRFIIPKIRGVLGLWSLETKGEASSIKLLRDTFDLVQSRAGTVTRILFDLTVTKVKSQKPGDASVYPVLNLIPNVSDENLLVLKEFIEAGGLQNISYIDDKKLLEIEEAKPKQIEYKPVDQKKGEVKPEKEITSENLFDGVPEAKLS